VASAPAPLLAIDGPFVMYRSFFALPESITDGDGHPVNALLGAVNLILRIAVETRPRVIVVCWGAEAAHYRTELYSDYHAARPPVPDALQWQFDRAPELVEAFGWTSLTSPELEADDLLGALAGAESGHGGRALVMTGDRDMYQCAAETVSIVYLAQGKQGFDTVDPAEVERRYGVAPELVPDFIALRGDPSDGLPGAPGIGAKTAAALLARHGSLEGVIANSGEERPRVAAAITEHAEQLRAFRDIATLRSPEVDLPADRETDLVGGERAARGYSMNRLADRLARARSLTEL
jgi:5'-3' exonuclease